MADSFIQDQCGADRLTRSGPKPLALHLANAVIANLGAAALPWLAGQAGTGPDGTGPGAQGMAPLPRDMLAQIRRAGPLACQQAVVDLGMERLEQFLAGVRRYQTWPVHPDRGARRVLARRGTVRLIDYADSGQPLLVIPSLINPPDILDLMDGHSLMAWLAGQGFRPVLVDWGAPDEEAAFDVGAYITERLEPLAGELAAITGQPPVAVGYCMGGLLACGLAARQTVPLRALALLAMPWDFHAGEGTPATARAARQMLPMIRLLGRVPPDLMAAFFAALDPTLVERKFRSFAAMPEGSERARKFVAVEDWVNSGPDLAGPAAAECLEHWYLDNRTACGNWRVGGTPVRLNRLTIRSFVAIPDRDRIVPPDSAGPAATALPNATVVRPQSGHIGMIVGRTSKTGLWDPLAHWLKAL